MTPDPYAASGGPSDPGSWNRYAYTRGDPVNRYDPEGNQDCGPEGSNFNCDGPPILFPGGSNGNGNTLEQEKNQHAGPSNTNIPGWQFLQLNRLLHAVVANAFANLSAQCESQLTADGFNVNAIATTASTTAYYTTQQFGNVTVASITGYVNPSDPGETLSQYIGDGNAAVLYSSSAQLSNDVVLGANFFTFDLGGYGTTVLASQIISLLHEALHTGTGLNDQVIAGMLGYGNNLSPDQASTDISDWLSAGCPAHPNQ